MMQRFSLPFRQVLLLCALAAVSPVLAADYDADEVMSGMQATLDATADASFLVTGVLHAADGTVYPLEVEAEAIPAAGVFRLEIFQPDALADNFIIVTEDELYNYSWMTNQVVVYRSDDPAALGPLAPDSDTALTLTLDLAELFSGWDLEVSGSEDTPDGPAAVLELTNRDASANITAATLVASEETWFPRSLVLVTREGDTLLDIQLSNFEADTGLSVDDLLWYPPDAEVIDER